MGRRRMLVLAVAASVTGCHLYFGDDDGRPAPDAPPAQPGFATVASVPVTAARDIDLLFVIDNSGNMLEAQWAVLDSVDRFLAAFDELPGGAPDLHVGVVSTDIGAGPYNIGLRRQGVRHVRSSDQRPAGSADVVSLLRVRGRMR